ncbi:lipolytic enzyme [Mycena leptocephala]|nr:lipolytic enzyme [Mycena leptocephala]
MRFSVFIAICFSTGVAFAQSQEWGQCGGIGWTGATTCVFNPYYSQVGFYLVSIAYSRSFNSVSAWNGDHHCHHVHNCHDYEHVIWLRIYLDDRSKHPSSALGDSITFGLESSDGNGYRNVLHNLLSPGNTVDFIGSLKSGTMADNDNEGHSGFTIAQIQTASTNAAALPARPNVILLMAGTNDVFGGSISTAPGRLSTLIDSIFAACPDAALVVATLTPLPSGQAAVDTYNQAVTQLVATRKAAGQHILLASMASVLASDWLMASIRMMRGM